jgi:sugar/nucleoside kinase (ribokinase family)
LKQARQAGCIVTADCLGVKRPDALALLADYLPFVDVFLPNEEEALLITGMKSVESAAALFRSMGATNVLITLAERGCYVATPDEVQIVPALDVQAVDATGCGDAMTAGVIAGLALDWDILQSVRMGTVAAGLTVQGLGSDAGDLSFSSVYREMQEAGWAHA